MAANTQPIFIRTSLHWVATLTNQVVPTVVTTQTPVSLGDAGTEGAVIETIYAVGLGSSGGILHLFLQGDNHPKPLLIIPPVTLSNTLTTVNLPDILFPAKTGVAGNNKGLRLESGASLMCALSSAVSGDGYNIVAIGGHY